jgi:hypothetical protein
LASAVRAYRCRLHPGEDGSTCDSFAGHSDGDGVIGEGDHGVSLQGGDLVVALRGGTIELAGVTALTADDLLI